MAALLDQFLLPFVEFEAFGVVAGSSGAAGTAFAYANAGIAGGASGAIATGTVKGAAMGAGEALAFAGVHGIKADLFGPEVGHSVAAVIASAGLHGMVGGMFNIGNKGGFASGFLAGGMSDFADEFDIGTIGNLVTHAVAGGLGSMLGGGKFENGAATGAFGYLFNHLLRMELNGQHGTLLVCETCNPKGMSSRRRIHLVPYSEQTAKWHTTRTYLKFAASFGCSSRPFLRLLSWFSGEGAHHLWYD